MTTVQIKEGDQLVLRFEASEAKHENEFIRKLVQEALLSSDGMAECEDNFGCTVTAIINRSECDPFANLDGTPSEIELTLEDAPWESLGGEFVPPSSRLAK